jgi:hypothetical protein
VRCFFYFHSFLSSFLPSFLLRGEGEHC